MFTFLSGSEKNLGVIYIIIIILCLCMQKTSPKGENTENIYTNLVSLLFLMF
jgi:hypothetical protein